MNQGQSSLWGAQDPRPIPSILFLIPEPSGSRGRSGPGSSGCGPKTGPVLEGIFFSFES